MGLDGKTDLRNSIYDVIFANMFAVLTGGVFLTGFALHFGMNELEIGLIAAMPFLVTVFELPLSYVILKRGTRKGISTQADFLEHEICFAVHQAWSLCLSLESYSTSSMRHYGGDFPWDLSSCSFQRSFLE
jgi:hypothetical protein